MQYSQSALNVCDYFVAELRAQLVSNQDHITELVEENKSMYMHFTPFYTNESHYAMDSLPREILFSFLRNFNSPNHGSNLQHIKHQAKTNLIKSVVTGEPTTLLRRRSNCKLGNTKSKCSRHIITTCISVVLDNFMKKRLTTKSREASCDLFRGSASSPYNKIGTHFSSNKMDYNFLWGDAPNFAKNTIGRTVEPPLSSI